MAAAAVEAQRRSAPLLLNDATDWVFVRVRAAQMTEMETAKLNIQPKLLLGEENLTSMSISAGSSETVRSQSESTKTTLTSAFPAKQIQKPSAGVDVKKKKKVTWNVKDKLQLQLQLKPKYLNQSQLKSADYAHAGTPTFSSLRLQKVVPLASATTTITTTTANTVSLSAMYAYHFFPTMGLAPSGSSPVIIKAASTPNKSAHPMYNMKKVASSGVNDNCNSNSNGSDHGKHLRNNCYKNDYTNNYIHCGKLPYKYIRNARQQVEGYPKLQRLYKLKEQQVQKYATRPYGCKVDTDDLAKTLNSWVYDHDLQFDVIMIGALTENQLIYPLLAKLPIDKLCSKPGFLFIWASTQKISELSTLMNDSRTWSKRFRRSEELVFIPVDKNSVYYPQEWTIPEDQLLEEVQWHCWMCITGTVRRSSDKDLIHCNVNTDLSLENSSTGNSAVPAQIYKVVENFSSSTRRLHIIPSSTGLKKHVNVRPGWVIVSPDVILDNFEPNRYKSDINTIGTNIPYDEEIESLRPKTPV